MNIRKLWFLVEQLEPDYCYLMDEVMSCFLQETIDSESFNNNGERNMSCEAILNEIKNDLNEDLTIIAQNCALEFCLTNEYLLEGQTWNCIAYLLECHADSLTSNDKKYLKALNNSHLGIYKVISVEPNISVTLEDMIEPNSEHLKILDKNLSRYIKSNQLVATRLLKIEYKTKPTEYRLSNTLIPLQTKVAEQSVGIIQMLTEAMNQPLLIQTILQEEERLEDNTHNRLMLKKMWAKEILEQWYLYHTNIMDYHELFDYEGNPMQPCSIEFDVTTEPSKLAKILNTLPDFIADAPNSWTWIDNTGYDNFNFSDIKDKAPSLIDPDKSPLYCGTVIVNERDKLSYRVFAEIKLKKNKLIINVASIQRANIAQDFIVTKCGNTVSNPIIIQKDNDYSNLTWN